jgi:hypothetical protein
LLDEEALFKVRAELKEDKQMKSWEALPDCTLQGSGAITTAFATAGIHDYRSAGRYVRKLPYGRNLDRADSLNVLREGRGTCSTKHALLARLAAEQQIPIDLVIGIYEMNGQNTPGVGAVIARYGLAAIPEAHCYLMHGDDRIDVTRNINTAEPIARFLYEQRISPDQIGAYKISMHQGFIREWLVSTQKDHILSPEQVWEIREECIAALSK